MYIYIISYLLDPSKLPLENAHQMHGGGVTNFMRSQGPSAKVPAACFFLQGKSGRVR